MRSILNQAAINCIKENGYQETLNQFNYELIELLNKSPSTFNISKPNGLQIEKNIGMPRRTYKKLFVEYQDNYER